MSLRPFIVGLLLVVACTPAAFGQTAQADGRYLQDWLLAGPFTEGHFWLIQVANTLGPGRLRPAEGQPALPLIEDVPSWTRYRAAGSQVNLIDAFGQYENSGALAFTTIRAERAGPATFYVGSDDQVRIWINDRLVHRYDEKRPLWPDQDCFTADLQAGENRCLVFVAQGEWNWGFSLRVVAGQAPAPVPFVWDVADVKGQNRELFTPHLRYVAEDKPDFAKPGLDDSAWPRVLPKGFVQGVKGKPVVWFRTRVWCTRALVNLPCRLSVTDAGDTEVFLDGRRVCAFGRGAQDGKGTSAPQQAGNVPQVGHESADAARPRSPEDMTPPIPFMFTAAEQVLAVRVVRDGGALDQDPFRLQLKLTVAEVIKQIDEAGLRKATEGLREEHSLRMHRLVLILALLLFLVFHAALLYYYPKRRANLMFCITLSLAVATLLVLDAEEGQEVGGRDSLLYWTFLALVSVCMLSGLALTHALWRGDLPKRKLLAWAAVLAALNVLGWVRGERLWALASLPLCTIEYLRLYFLSGWRRLPGGGTFGIGLACFVAAQAVDVVNHLLPFSLASGGLVTYLWVYGFVTLLACVSVNIGREFAGAFRKLEDLTATLDERVRQVTQQLETKLLAQARLETLRYQLNPHFLFNALNSVEALSREEPAQIPEVVRRLCECLRYGLQPKKGGIATLEQELSEVTSYLRVEHVRFGEQLMVEMDISDAARQESVPEFLLQPLVENAIKYGMRTSEMPLRIVIRAGRADDRLQVEVRNTGSWSSADGDVRNGGIGLENLRKRLQLLYPDRCRLTTQAVDGWVSVTVEIPRKHEDPARGGSGE